MYELSLDGIAVNVIPMMNEVLIIADSVIREPALPDFTFAPDDFSQSVGVATLDELNGVLQGHVVGRS